MGANGWTLSFLRVGPLSIGKLTEADEFVPLSENEVVSMEGVFYYEFKA